MNPIYDMLKSYAQSDRKRYCMPGHKGSNELFKYDVTELLSTDDLYSPSGAIKEAEKLFSKEYKKDVLFSPFGSTGCIGAMLMEFKGKRVLFDRAVHKNVINYIALFDIVPVFVEPEFKDGIVKTVSTEKIAEVLESDKSIEAVFIAGVNYFGYVCDYEGIAKVCKQYNVFFMVDNAHGAYFMVFDKRLHPSSYDVDMFCDSIHKTLPALTGASILCTNGRISIDKLRYNLSVLCSSSPSFLILSSIDKARNELKQRDAYLSFIKRITEFKEKIKEFGYFVHECDDAFKILISGDLKELNLILQKNNVDAEIQTDRLILFMLSPRCDLDFLQKVLLSVKPEQKKLPDIYFEKEFSMPLKEAFFSKSESVLLSQSQGRISAQCIYSYPPAMAVVMPGQRITKEATDYLDKDINIRCIKK